MKSFALIVLISLLTATHKTIKKSPLQLSYDKVIMYHFNGGMVSDMSIVDSGGHIATSMTKQFVLDKESALSLTKKLGQKESFVDEMASCFEPGLGFVYYLKGKIVLYITVCLDCDVVVSSIPLNPQKPDKFWAGGYLVGAPSKPFHAFLKRLSKKHHF